MSPSNEPSSPVSAPGSAAARSHFWARAGLVCAISLGVSVLGAFPTALRVMGSGASFWGGFLAAMAVLWPFLAVLYGLFRAAGRGMFSVWGNASDRKAALFLALWIGFSVPPLMVLGWALRAGTHHRGLGGATFGVLALAVVGFSLILSYRVHKLGRRLSERGVPRWILAAVGAFISVLPLMLAALPLLRSDSSDAAVRGVQATLIDASISIVGVALVHSLQLENFRGPNNSLVRVSSLLGLPAALALCFAGAVYLEASRTIGPALKSGGGLAASLIGALEAWTDRDDDGFGSHFGGGDCDEGDPARNPGAQDLPGDGVDLDCDGADAPAGALAAERPAPAVNASGAKQALAPVSAAASAPAAPPGPKPAPNAAAKPDIYLITLDTVRADHTSVYGYERKTTPNLEALAAKGIVFERAYAAGSDTQRALIPLVSGKRFSSTARDRREWPTILPENETVAERLKKAGYVTAGVTSFTWLSGERGFQQGFDRFEAVYDKAHPERDVTGDQARSAVVSILKELEARAQPLFLWVHLFDAHDRYLEHEGISFGKGTMARYDGEIAFVDKMLGEIVTAISKSGRASMPAAYIVHGSHGEAFGEHDFSGHGTELYEEVLRVPFVVAAPGCPPGRHGANVVSTVDIAPTVLAFAGAGAEGVEGNSLVDVLRGDSKKALPPVFARAPRRAALIDGAFKLIVIERKKKDRFLLFDLSADPKETKDISSERPSDLARLIAAKAAFEPPEKSP